MFRQHPSSTLNTLFARRPFQGADPRAASFLFIGLDANYAEDLEFQPSFPSVVDYHTDGVAFWRRHGVHHPFLLPTYTGSGRPYHRNFARIGFGPEHASQVSFVEMLHVPTVGTNDLELSDLDCAHLACLNETILHGQAKHIFVSADVAVLMKASRMFPWLVRLKPTSSSALPVLQDLGNKRVYKHLHFSNYGKFRVRMGEEAQAIHGLLKDA